MAGIIIGGVIFGVTALIMLGIGIAQLKSKAPVGFYTNEEPLHEAQLTDVRAWNREHGLMWIGYSVCLALGYAGSAWIGDELLALAPMMAGVLLPLIPMMLNHRRLVKKYQIK